MTVRLEHLEGFEAVTRSRLIGQGWGYRTWSNSDFDVTMSGVRSGSRGLKIEPSNWGYVSPPKLSVSARSIVTGIAMSGYNISSANVIQLGLASPGVFSASGGQIVIRYSPINRNLEVWRGYASTADTVPTGTLLGSSAVGSVEIGPYVWGYIEVRIFVDDTNGYVELLFNGLRILELTGVDTQYQTASNFIDRVAFCWAYAYTGTAEIYFDDLYTFSDDSSTLTTQECIGDARVLPVAPISVGAYSQLTPSSGTDHVALVDENPFSTADYVGSAVSGVKETFKFTGLAGWPYIHGVKSVLGCFKSDAGLRSVKPLIKSGAVETVAGNKAVATDLSYINEIYKDDPNTGTSWTTEGLGDAEFGAEVG